MTTKTLRVVAYSRVSTAHDQDPEVQLAELREYCESREWNLIETIADHGFSGGSDQRPGLKKLLALVRSRGVDVVLVVKLDRLARSLKHLLTLLEEFASLGVSLIALKDQIDLTSASGRFMTHILAAFGEFERALIRERTLAGLAHARRKGKRLGRPPKSDVKAIQSLRRRGLSYSEIALLLGESKGAVYRALNAPEVDPDLQKNSANSGGTSD